MGYKLEQPFTEEERLDFIVKYNYQDGLRIDEYNNNLYALEANESLVNGEFQTDTEYEANQLKQKRDYLNKLSLTKREVFLAIYNDKGITPEEIKTEITDTASLIEFEYANDYYRGNPLIETIGESLGYCSSDLDYLFENGKFPEREDSDAGMV